MFKMQRYGLADIVPVAGQRRTTRVNNKLQTHRFGLLPQSQVDVTVAGTDVLNRGSVWGIYDEVGVLDAGDEVINVDGPTARFLSEMHAPSALDRRRLTSAGVQAATIIRESSALWFAHPLSANGAETTFLERDERNQVEVFVKLKADGGNSGLIRTGATMTVTNNTVKVFQDADRFTPSKPYFIPTIRQVVVNVAAANPQLELLLKVQNPLRAVVVKQETDQGEVGDIITSLRFLSDTRQIIGPNFINWRDLTMAQGYEFGGDVFTDGVGYGQNGYLGINFQSGGRLSNVLDARREPNLRFEFNATPSTQTGAANSRIRVTLLELERRQGLVADEVPFPI
jgi:hypothetical protein